MLAGINSYATMVEFVVRDSKAVAQAAAASSFWRNFRSRYAWPFLGAAIFWPLMIVLTYRAFGDTWLIGFLGFFLFLTLAFTPLFYFARKRAAAEMVKRYPERRVRITSVDLTISTSDDSTTLAWHLFKEILEYPSFFVLMREWGFYCWLPKSEMPDDALMTVRQIAAALPSNNRLERAREE